MRKVERIDPFIDIIKTQECELTTGIRDLLKDEFDTKMEQLRQIWKDNPDWRFTQLLVNTGCMPNIPGMWYYQEEHQVIPKEFRREILFWGTYGVDGDQPLREVAIKDMDTDHIEAVLALTNVSKVYVETMKDEITMRESSNGPTNQNQKRSGVCDKE